MFLRTLLACLALATGAQAACEGQDLRETLTEAERAALNATIASTPYPEGNHWRAERDGAVIHLIGTLHLSDPRLDAPAARLQPVIEAAGLLLVESDTASEAALRSLLGSRPDLLILQGTSLPEQLTEEDWQRLAEQARIRGIPPLMAARFQPWYLSTLLGTPPCAQLAEAAANGLDKRMIAMAGAADVPTAPLEPFDTVFTSLAGLPLDTQLVFLRAAVEQPDLATDLMATTITTYFDERHAETWELNRILSARGRDSSDSLPLQIADAQLKTQLLDNRNRNWIPVILSNLDKQPLVAAFGAGHLFGENGVLNLLKAQGFKLTRLPF